MKPLHAGWIVDFYNLLTTAQGKEIIDSGWKVAGIADAIRVGLNAKVSSVNFLQKVKIAKLKSVKVSAFKVY